MTLIAFDMDGTLYDCGEIVGDAFRRGMENFSKQHNIPLNIPTTEKIMSYVGFPTDYIFRSLFPEVDENLISDLNNECTIELSNDVRQKKGILYEGVVNLLKELNKQDNILTVASNGMLPYLRAIVATYGLDNYFEEQIYVIDNENIFNKNEILQAYIGKYNPKKTIMIGDRVSDMEAAHYNNSYFIGCAFGHAGDKEFKNEKYIVHSLSEITKIIDEINGELNEK